jgi:hypothetical protein
MTEENGEKKARELHVTVDSEQMKQLAMDLAKEKLKNEKLEHNYNPDRVNEQLKDEVEDLKGKLELTAEIALAEKKKKLGLAPDNQMTPDQVMAYEKGLESGSDKKSPSGSAPLQDNYFEQQKSDLYKHKFENEKEMVSTLQKLAREGNSEAKSYLDALMAQFIKAKKANPNVPDVFYDPNQASELPLMKSEHGFLTPVDKNEGDLGKLIKKWKDEARAKREEGVQK